MQAQCSTPQAVLSADQRLALLAGLDAPGPMRAVIESDLAISYARVSKSVQESLRDQLRYNLRNAQRLAVVVAIELEDEKSGLLSDREEYQKLLRLAESRQYGHLLVYKADRLSRDDVEFLRTVLRLLALGMRIWDYRIGEITARNARELAQQAWRESRNIADRTQDGLEMKAEDGVKLGAPRLGYIHTDPPDKDHRYPLDEDGQPDQYRPHPTIGPAMTQLFQRCAAGESLYALQRWFNTTTGRKMDMTALKGVLRSEYYKGLNVNCKTRASRLDGHYARPRQEWQVRYHHWPLVDSETWDKVQARLEANQHVGQQRGEHAKYALQGILWCGRCNLRMRGQANGRKASCYRCEVCNVTRGALKTEAAVRKLLAQIPVPCEAAGAAYVAAIGSERQDLEARLGAVQARISQLSGRRTHLAIRLAERSIDDEQYRQAMAQTDTERDALRQQEHDVEAQLQRLPGSMALAGDVAQRLRAIASWPELSRNMPIHEVQEMYRECCNRIVIDPDHGTVSVEYTEHMARWYGRSAATTDL